MINSICALIKVQIPNSLDCQNWGNSIFTFIILGNLLDFLRLFLISSQSRTEFKLKVEKYAWKFEKTLHVKFLLLVLSWLLRFMENGRDIISSNPTGSLTVHKERLLYDLNCSYLWYMHNSRAKFDFFLH